MGQDARNSVLGGRRCVALAQCGGVSGIRNPPKHQSLKDNNQFQSCVLYSKSWNNPLRLTIQTDGFGQVSLLQGIFPTQGSNPGLPHFGWILYQLSQQGSPPTILNLQNKCCVYHGRLE